MKIKRIIAFITLCSAAICSCAQKSADKPAVSESSGIAAVSDIPEVSVSSEVSAPAAPEKDTAVSDIPEVSVSSGSSAPVTTAVETSVSDETSVTTEDKNVPADTVSGMAESQSSEKRYTPDDFYMECINVGYISGMPYMLMITDNAQLESAKKKYPLSIPDDADEHQRWLLDNILIKPFTEMTEKYPVEEYTYLLEYISESGGCSVKAGGLCISGDRLYFYPSEDSRWFPDDNGMIPDVCSDYCYIAAVPKEYLCRTVYKGWLIPDENEMYQDS